MKRTLNLFGWLVFAENVTDKDLPDEPPVEEGKTRSERLRSALFVFWKKKKVAEDFDTWRNKWMDSKIEKILSECDD